METRPETQFTAAPRIARLGHVALVTPDLDASVEFWRQVVGLEEVERRPDGDGETSVFLRAWGDFEHHTLTLTSGAEAAVDHVGWRTREPDDVWKLAALLERGGVQVEEIAAGTEPGIGKAVRFATPAGHCFELYYEVEKPLAPEGRRSRLQSNSARAWARGISPRRLDHVNIVTDDTLGLAEWLGEALGFDLRECIRLDDGTLAGAWLAVTNLMHDIAVMTGPDGAPAQLHHVAYWLDTGQDVMRAADILQEQAIVSDAGPGKHGISQAIYLYVKDPGSGHRLELFSGGYLVLDPDWEPIEWPERELGLGMTWWGPDLAGVEAMETTTKFRQPAPKGQVR
jgi:catechol 2,3 dioxygenase